MPKVLSTLELRTLKHIVFSQYTIYNCPTKLHSPCNRMVLCIGATTVHHLNVEAVDILRFEGYVKVIDKNHSGSASIQPTDLGHSLIREFDE